MSIIDIETEDIADIKIIIEILSGFISEANADFIKDSKSYNEKASKKNSNDEDEDNEEEEEDNEEEDSDKNKNASAKKPKKKGRKGKKGEVAKTGKEENNGEIKILTSDSNQAMITFITLKGSAFKKFNLKHDKYSVGLNLDELYKYIKNVDKEGVMSIRIDADDTQHIIFDVKSNNAASHESICELRVLNLSNNRSGIIEVEFVMAVRINCQAFHKACKDLLQFSQFVEITCDPTQFIITCKGDLSNHSRIFKANGSQNGIIIKTAKKNNDEEIPEIIRLVFDLKYINSMYKCSSLCDDMVIYLNPGSVMFLKYGINLMGEMLVGIAPSTISKKKENVSNFDENDDMYYQQNDDEIVYK